VAQHLSTHPTSGHLPLPCHCQWLSRFAVFPAVYYGSWPAFSAQVNMLDTPLASCHLSVCRHGGLTHGAAHAFNVRLILACPISPLHWAIYINCGISCDGLCTFLVFSLNINIELQLSSRLRGSVVERTCARDSLNGALSLETVVVRY